jgi:hypothetical protein
MGRKGKSNEDLIVLAVVALLVWVGRKVKGSFRLILTLVLVTAAILALSSTKAWMAGFVVIGIAFMWREKLPQGFYLRRALSVGPLRLNLSTSGLGGSVGVKGARIGRRPDGTTYVHAGRGGVYYRKELPREDSRGSEAAPCRPTLPPANACKGLSDLGQSAVPPGEPASSCTGPPRVQGLFELWSGLPSVDSEPEPSAAAFYCGNCGESYPWEALVEVRQCEECDHQFDASSLGTSCPTCGHEQTHRMTKLACPKCLVEADQLEAGPVHNWRSRRSG